MQPKDVLDVVALLMAVGTTVTVVRTNTKKQIIEEQKQLIEAHEKTIAWLKERVASLEEIVYGDTEVVPEGHIPRQHGQGSRNRSASTKTTKNRAP